MSQILFYIAIVIVMFVPGWFLLLVVFGHSGNRISRLERFLFSFGLGLIVTDFIAFLFNKLSVPITARTSILGVIIFSAICLGIYKIKCHSCENRNPVSNQPVSTLDSRLRGNDNAGLFNFSKNQLVLIFLLLFLTIFIKAAYLTGTVAPTATDMGHHTYWTKQLVETHKLPTYDGMPDFIIGEHVALGEIAMISHLDFFGAGPVVFLFLINILGILTVFLLTLRIFKNKNIAILSLLFLGVLFAVSSPQAKFVSGGVFGNIMGNFLMPLAFYFYYRTFEFLGSGFDKSNPYEKNAKTFLALAILTTFGLFYTHHLTSFVFLFVWMMLIPLYLIINIKNIKEILISAGRIIFSKPVLITFFTGLIFFFFILTPNYVKTSAVQTAVGTPSKSTRAGLSLTNLKDSVGEARLAIGILGLLVLVLACKQEDKRKNFGLSIVAAWTLMLFVMSCLPQFLLINLPSDRIGNYTSYPLAILSAFGFFFAFSSNAKEIIPKKFLVGIFLIAGAFVLTNGLYDSADAFKKSPDFTPTLETFDASKYLAEHTAQTDVILKDHNYLGGDTWMKLFFMRGYNYPLSRGYFKRYEDPTKPREMCTLEMISNPNSEKAQECFSETDTKYLVVNPKYDSLQFSKLKNFDEIYNSGEVAVYYKK